MTKAVRTGTSEHYHRDDSDHSKVNRTFSYRRLKKNALSLLSTGSRFSHIGRDEVVEALASENSFERNDLVIFRVTGSRSAFIIICVPNWIWNDPARFVDVRMVKQQAAELNRSVVLVRESFVQREPRLSNAEIIDESGDTRITIEDRSAVLELLVENGFSTVGDCAAAVQSKAPIPAILKMAALGIVDINVNRAITLDTRVDLAGYARMAG